MANCPFVEVNDKEINEIKINSVPKKPTKDLCKNTKTIIRLRLGDYRIGDCYIVSVKVQFFCLPIGQNRITSRSKKRHVHCMLWRGGNQSAMKHLLTGRQ